MIVGIEHVAIASPDPQKLAEWYVGTLGFVINYNSGRTVFVKAPNGLMIEIIASEGARPYQTLKDPGLRHLALTVADFDAAYARLKDAGVKFISEPADLKGVKVVFFEDPDGNYLHLLQRSTPLP
jgi:glyoxylase I family protein